MFNDKQNYLSDFIKLIKPYDPIDLLAKVGALQLCPENANHAIRLEAFAHAINCLKFEPDKPIMTRHKLEHICNAPPLGNSNIQSQEDPTPNAFTEAFTFFGGSYIVLPGQLSEPTFILKHLNTAIFLGDGFKAYKQFKKKVYILNRSLLVISDVIARRAGLKRNMAPNPLSINIYIPQEIEVKKSLVVFSCQEINDILGSVGCELSSLEPFIQQFGQLNDGSYSFQNSPLHSHPIIKFDDRLIIAEPWMLLASLRHHILLTAKLYGVLGILSEEYQKAVVFNVEFSLDRFRYNPIPLPLHESDPKLYIRESLWTLDTDKILYAVVITDNFTDYLGNEVFEDDTGFEDGELLDEHLVIVEEQIRKETINLGEIFFLIIDAGIGRSRIIGLQLEKLTTDPIVLMLSVSELEIFSLLYGNDSLVLYKFAKAQNVIRKSAKVISWSTLDEFEIYRKKDYSYYLDDGARPRLIAIGAGEERQLRLEVLQKYDIHAVPYFEKDGWIEVVNVYQTPSCPIYSTLNNLRNQINYFVELSPISFWVITNIKQPQLDNNNHTPNPGIFVDMISYWIWQFGQELSGCLTGVNYDFPLVIELMIDESQKWGRDLIQTQSEMNPLSISIVSEHKIIVTIMPSILNLLNTPDNSGEIQIMKMLLNGLCELLHNDGWIEQSKKLINIIPRIVETHSSNPRKKKILSLDPNFAPSLLLGNPISFRKIQEADRSILLDEIGDYLRNELHLAKGIIPKEQYKSILNSIVGYYFKKLTQIVNNQSPEHLLDFLVTHYEAIINEKATRQITIPTQLACFSSIQELTQQLTEQLPAINEAAIACRFLIEFVTTQPPTGKSPISLATYDQLMAISAETIGRGNQSDFNWYKLFDFNFELLNSGRLGFNRSEYESNINSFQSYRFRADIEEAEKSFPKWWKERVNTDQNDLPPHINKLNQAFEAEFGLILTDISHFISELGSLSMRMDSRQFKVMEYDALINEITEIMGWSSEKILSTINFLSLSPRKFFLEPPKPFQKADIYPWRMSRGLSYMRRPLLMVTKNDKKNVCWGVRHLFSSFDYLLQSTVSGRLQDDFQSKEMREFLGNIHTKEGEEFNNQVYKAVLNIPGVIVGKKVKKFGKTKIGPPGNDLGDLDVVAVISKSKTILVIECKDLEVARNAIEISRELEALFIGNFHNESTLTKHLRRIEWMKNNLAVVLKAYGINDYMKWRIEPLLVVSSEMITPHFYKISIPVFSYSRFISEYLPQYS